MRKLFYCDTVGNLGSIPLLILRVVMGVAFMYHGYPKIQNPMGWMGESGPPEILQAAAAFSEFGGGAALIAGFLTRLASLGLGATMVGAVQFHVQRGDPFVPSGPGQGGWELAAVYLACSLLFLILGPGRISLDALFFGSREPATPGHA
jgi:putative oxidoreductase